MASFTASTPLSSILARGIAAKSSPRKGTTWGLRRSRLKATKGVSSVCEPLPPDRPLWFPGSSPPEWLDGSLPGDFGFDPLGLGSDPELLKWFAQAELMHSRWAMLAVAGILIPEWLESLGFIDNFSWYDAGAREYFTDPATLFVGQMILMGWAEGRRWADMMNPGCVDIEPTLPHKKKPKPDVGYPGGLWFDPLMWGRGSPEPVMVLRTKEIKNGRLAMLAFVGFCFQAVYTGEGPIENLMAHIADPGHCNIFSVYCTNSLSLCAKHHGIPFFVADPSTSLNLSIQETSAKELLNAQSGLSEQVAASRIAVWNDAFGVTPACIITGIITEKGVITKKGTEAFDINGFIQNSYAEILLLGATFLAIT